MRFTSFKEGIKPLVSSVQKADRTWQAVLGDLQLQVTRPSYETWLRGTVGISSDSGRFVVGTPSTFIAEMLEQRMYSLISDSLEKVTNAKAEVSFQVMPGGQPAMRGPGLGIHPPEPNHSKSMRSPQGTSGSHPLFNYSSAPLNPKYTLDRFIVGDSNELAHAASFAVSESPGKAYNPLFIYSRVGLGKTHLLHAIGHKVSSMGMSVIYTTAEDFTNEYIKSIREGKTDKFRSRYRTSDVLLLDDIQFIAGKEQTQEGFFHTFNALYMSGRQIVVTSDQHASSLTLLADRIRSRLAGGVVVDIQPPGLETRLAILRAKAENHRNIFHDDILHFLAEKLSSNVRELEGTLNRLPASAELTSRDITLEMAQQALMHSSSRSPDAKLTVQSVLDAVSKCLSVEVSAIKSKRRDKNTASARHIAMYLMREDLNLTLESIGKLIGDRDHSTVLHSFLRTTKLIKTDQILRKEIIEIRNHATRT